MKIRHFFNKRRNTLLLFAFLISFLILLLAYSIVGIYLHKQNTVEYTFDIVASEDHDLDVNLKITRSWCNVSQSGQISEGAQYDGAIINDTDCDFTNWELLVYLDEPSVIDSFWYGTYDHPSQQELIVHPVKSNETVYSGSKETFGFVMTSDHLQFIDHYVLKGYFHISPTDFPFFNVLLVLSGIWLFFFILYIAVFSRISVYERRERHNRKVIIQAMKTFSGFIDAKDKYTKGHSSRVADYTKLLCKKLNLSDNQIENYYYIALLHDCGKIGIPDNILNKPGKLTPEERQIIESHTTIGGQVLSEFSAIDGIIDGAKYHHERYDGKGYPQGLSGKSIPFVARIISVADSFDAMNSDRCYRKKLDKDIILQELKKNSGKQFDPEIVKYMIDMIESGEISLETN